jgi:hypothetical protein
MTSGSSLPAILVTTAAALLLAACGGGSGGDGASADESNEAKRLAYFTCLRKAGVTVTERTAGAERNVEVRVPTSFSKTRMAALERDCARRTGGGPNRGAAPSPAEQARFLDQALKFSRCMRAHGVQMGDPVADGNGIRLDGPKLDKDSPAFRRAGTACEAFNPKGKGGRSASKKG